MVFGVCECGLYSHMVWNCSYIYITNDVRTQSYIIEATDSADLLRSNTKH